MINLQNYLISDRPHATSSDEFLVIENLTKVYKRADGMEFLALEDINLTIKENEFVAVVGHSGCGKSTLLKIVAGLEKATLGSVRLQGKEVRKPGADRMMVFQHYSLLPWLTVRQNIRLAVDEVLDYLTPTERRLVVDEHLEMVSLLSAADKYPDEISGGMRQRVGIARAIATRPVMLLMDEPFGALDALTRSRLQRQVLDIWESHRQSVMMITHDIDEALYMADKIVLMTNGPAAQIGEIITVPFPRKRNLQEMRKTKLYYELRNHALSFLDHHFGQED